jgi:hypothetical protein
MALRRHFGAFRQQGTAGLLDDSARERGFGAALSGFPLLLRMPLRRDIQGSEREVNALLDRFLSWTLSIGT